MNSQYILPSWKFRLKLILNQVIIGSQEGPLQLWNVSTRKKLYEFKGWNSSVCCCVASPALDVVAVGCSDGTIHVHNMRYDEELVSFPHSVRGSVTALSFRTGNMLIWCFVESIKLFYGSMRRTFEFGYTECFMFWSCFNCVYSTILDSVVSWCNILVYDILRFCKLESWTRNILSMLCRNV